MILLLIFLTGFLPSCNKELIKIEYTQLKATSIDPRCHPDSLSQTLKQIRNDDQYIRYQITASEQEKGPNNEEAVALKRESIKVDSLLGVQMKALIKDCPEVKAQPKFALTIWLVAQHCGSIEERIAYYQPKLSECYRSGELRKDMYLGFLDRTYSVLLFFKKKEVPPWPSMSEVELIEYFEKAIKAESD